MNRNIINNYICYKYIIYKSKKSIDLNDKTVYINLYNKKRSKFNS